jgi:enoyl-CoA hydratase/carnithine racemase
VTTIGMSEFQTILYEETDGVAWVTLNRPEAHNAFNDQMQRELRGLWHGLRYNDDVRCIVLTGAGDKGVLHRYRSQRDHGSRGRLHHRRPHDRMAVEPVDVR